MRAAEANTMQYAVPITTEPTNGCRVTENPKTAVSWMPGMAYTANVPVTAVRTSTAMPAASCCPRPIASRRRCVVAHRPSPALASRTRIMTPQISQVGPGATPIAGGPRSATSTHTPTAMRLAVRARRTPSA